MTIVVSQSGDALEVYRPGGTLKTLAEYPDLPLVFACVVARCRGEIVFVFNNYRQLWEVPAGHIDPGETAEAAGVRELAEESGQRGAVLRQSGLALVYSRWSGKLELGVMFTCELAALESFTPNDEISAVMLWDMRRPVAGEVDHLSRKLVELMSV